nr:MAG TPA: hypothetical protein [Caudoviricetes sp.]
MGSTAQGNVCRAAAGSRVNAQKVFSVGVYGPQADAAAQLRALGFQPVFQLFGGHLGSLRFRADS